MQQLVGSSSPSRGELGALERWRDRVSANTAYHIEHKQKLPSRFEAFAGPSIQELVNEWWRRLSSEGRQPQFIQTLLLDWHKELLKGKIAPSSASTYVNAIVGIFAANDIPLSGLPSNLRVRGASYEVHRVLELQDVRSMVKACDDAVDRAILVILSQSGQREAVLSAMRFDQIREIDGCGVIDVQFPYENAEGRNVNKAKVHYTMVFGQNSLQVINDLPRNGRDFLFQYKDIGSKADRVVESAAVVAGLQKSLTTRLGNEKVEIRPHTLRSFWEGQQDDAYKYDKESDKQTGLDPIQRNYMEGHAVKYDGTYFRKKLTPERLVQGYKQAESGLAVLD